jgi:hypothetical protein
MKEFCLPFRLFDSSVDALGGTGVRVEDLGKFGSVGNRLDEDDDLVELKSVDQVDQLLGLLVRFELNVVLLEAVQG